LNAGMNAYLNKPLRSDEFIAVVEEYPRSTPRPEIDFSIAGLQET
jgi:hypothetical protein